MTTPSKDVLKKRADDLIARDGHLTPDALIAEARDPASPFHSLFEWNLERAAYAHWVDRAREIIRSIEITVEIAPARTVIAPAYVKNPSAPKDRQSYVPLSSVQADIAAARLLISDEVGRISTAVERARRVSDALGLSDDFDRLMAKIQGIRQKLDEAA